MMYFEEAKTLEELNEQRSKLLLKINNDFQARKKEIIKATPDYKVVRIYSLAELNVPDPDATYPVYPPQRQGNVTSPVLVFDSQGAVNF